MPDPRNPLNLDTSGRTSTVNGVPVAGQGNVDAAKAVQAGMALAPAINQANLNYLNLGIPHYGALTQTESGNIENLLHPTDFSDVQRRAAEQAVGGGYAGSGFAGLEGLHQTEEEKIRRQMIGSNMLSGAAARLPAPFNPASLLSFRSERGPGVGQPAPGPVSYSTPPAINARSSPLSSPGDAAPVVMPGTNPSHNWLSDIISRYSPEASGGGATPLYQTRSSDPSFGNEVNPITGMLDYNTDENGQAIIPGQRDAYDSPDADYLAGNY